MSRHSRNLARAMREHTKEHVEFHMTPHGRLMYGTIVGTDPRSVELHEGNILLEEDDLLFTQWVEHYDSTYGLEEGDTVVVTPMHNGDYLVNDVVSDTDVS